MSQVELVLKGVIRERMVSPYVILLVIVSRKKGSKIININAISISQIIVNTGVTQTNQWSKCEGLSRKFIVER